MASFDHGTSYGPVISHPDGREHDASLSSTGVPSGAALPADPNARRRPRRLTGATFVFVHQLCPRCFTVKMDDRPSFPPLLPGGS